MVKQNGFYDASVALGRGVGQVMFQDNALSGLLMLVGLCFGSWQMAILALAGNAVSTLTALWHGCNREDIRNGLYGFNGTLVGIAAGVFLRFEAVSWGLTAVSVLLMVVASALSTYIVLLFRRQKYVSAYTMPFILAVWLLLGFCRLCIPQVLAVADETGQAADKLVFLQATFGGIGQVMFQDGMWSGLFFLLALVVHSPKSAIYTIWGSLLPIVLASMCSTDATTVNAGMMGYNGVLCALALGDKTVSSFLWATAAVALSVVLQQMGLYCGVPTLTAPFVFSVWMILLIRKKMKTCC